MLRGRRRRGVVCWVRGHVWSSQPTALGVVMLACCRCGELVAVPFVDQADVLGLPAACGPETWLGEATSARQAIDLVAALLVDDREGWRRLRAQASARPGDAVDALATLATALSRAAAPAHPLRYVHTLGCYLELAALDTEIAVRSREEHQ